MNHRSVGFTKACLLFISVTTYGPIVPGESFQNTATIPQKGRALFAVAPKISFPLPPRRASVKNESPFSNQTARFALSLPNPAAATASSEAQSSSYFYSKALSKQGIIITMLLPAVVLILYLAKLLPKFRVAMGTLAILFDNLLTDYKTSMVINPLQTKVATGVSLAVLGDAMAQIRESKPYDARRAVSFAGFDSCYRFFQHFAFPFIVQKCQGRVLGAFVSLIPNMVVTSKLSHLFATAERTFAYQFGVIPFFYYPVFFAFTGLIQGLTLRETFSRAKANFLPCWKRNIMFWVPIQMVMFGLIDEKWQIPFVCLMGMIWSTILSVTAGKAAQSKK